MTFTAATMMTALILGGASGLPPDFEHAVMVVPLFEPTVIEFLPDGRMLIGLRDGTIRVYADGALQPAPLLRIPAAVDTEERGLVGLAVDPQFTSNGFIYAYYTTIEPRNRVSRFTVAGSAASLASEFVIWQNAQTAGAYHHGGAIAVHPADGRLYITTGDQFTAPNAQLLTNEHGKLLRVALDGSIPPDNPYAAGGGLPSIYARGLRNPFRMTIDRVSGALWVGDVGGNSSSSWEEINLAAPGANFGASLQEGPTCFSPPCAGVTFPRYAFQHSNPAYYVSQPQASITIGPVYRASQFPIDYCGSMLVGDYANRWIRRLMFDAGGQVVADPVFVAAPGAGTIVDLKVGPDGAVYYVTHGVPWSGAADLGAVHRIAYLGPIINADLSGDCRVNGIDIALLLGQWTSTAYVPCPPHRPADFNHDCKVNGVDLAILLGAWAP